MFAGPLIFDTLGSDYFSFSHALWSSRLLVAGLLGLWIGISRSAFFLVNSSIIGAFLLTYALHLFCFPHLNLIVRLLNFGQLSSDIRYENTRDISFLREFFHFCCVLLPLVHMVVSRLKRRIPGKHFTFRDEEFELI
jgi:hypothetical protein